jgi:TIGR03009 family protein
MGTLAVASALALRTATIEAQEESAAPAQPREARSQEGRLNRRDLPAPDLVQPPRAKLADFFDERVQPILAEWSRHSKTIRKLKGRHERMIVDYTFNVENVSEGAFYYERPDHGRIDFQGSRIDPAKKTQQRVIRGEMQEFKIQPGNPERWICDGKVIRAIDDVRKTYDVVEIPPEQRGDNIMDGPLPFLFGMPPEKANQRYFFKLISETPETYRIGIMPKLKQDAGEWKRADLELGKKDYLPVQVRLYDPAGTKDTIYKFHDLQVNRINLIPWANPFDPMLIGYKPAVRNTAPQGVQLANNAQQGKGPIQQQGGAQMGPWAMPSVVGMPYAAVKKKFNSLGIKVIPRHGTPAPDSSKIFHVEEQQPPARTQIRPGDEVILTLYDRIPIEEPGTENKSPSRRTATKISD